MPVPQRLTYVTLGARSVPALRAFYAAWGWSEREWGGYSGYVADPEGNRWELAHLPGYIS